MYWPDISQIVTKMRDFGRDGYHFCLIFKQKAGWLVGMEELYLSEVRAFVANFFFFLL